MEKWKIIKGYEKYMISDQGQVKRLASKKKMYPSEQKLAGKEKILKPQDNSLGYKIVRLYSGEGNYKQFTIHSLVMYHFVGERFFDENGDKLDIDHLNGNRSDNRLENLQYISHLENVRRINKRSNRKAVLQYDGDILIKEYESAYITDRYGFNKYCVGMCCRGESKTHKGFIWKFKDE